VHEARAVSPTSRRCRPCSPRQCSPTAITPRLWRQQRRRSPAPVDAKRKVQEVHASVILACAQRHERAAARDRIAEVLTEAKKGVRECGTTGHLPFLHAELAELAQLDVDNEGYDDALREAQQLFEETGACAHAAKVAKLAALAA
jgi:hypothetical protein